MYRIKQFIKYSFILFAIITLVYWTLIRPMHVSWGASLGEITVKLPVDELISSNRIVSTRAINISAAKVEIWPWIAQTG